MCWVGSAQSNLSAHLVTEYPAGLISNAMDAVKQIATPANALATESRIPEAPPGFKSGFIAILGRPNVGKSTLMNHLIGQKVAITSPIAQTTRNRLRGILTTDQAQVIFVDTPGIHKPHHQLGKVLVQNAKAAIRAVDVVLFLVDAALPLGPGDRYIAELLAQSTSPVVVGLNKADLQTPEEVELIDQSYGQLAEVNDWSWLKFSALKGQGTEALQEKLCDCLTCGPYYYPPELITDQPERFIMGEVIREEILHLTREEIPHSVAVSVQQVEETPRITRVFATIHVERKSQKGILIGKGGSMLKAIGTSARAQMQKLIDGKVYVELFVRVDPRWRQSPRQLAEFGYRIED